MTPEPIAAGARTAPARGTRRYRLTGKGAFEALFRAGSRLEGSWLQLIAAPASTAPGRIGFVIGRRVLRHAVDRNRVRRVLRVAVAQARPAIEAFDVILRLKRGCLGREVRALAAEAAALLSALAATGREGAPR